MAKLGAHSTMVFALLTGLLWPAIARGQTLVGRFYPEKHSYLVGEPVFIDFQLDNTGDQPAWVGQRMGAPCIEPDTIKVAGAQRRELEWLSDFGCSFGVGGDCAEGVTELKPGAKHTARIFLSAEFRLSRPGTYPIHALRKVSVYPSEALDAPSAAQNIEFSSDFQIRLVQGSEKELKLAFEPYVEAATKPDNGDQSSAIWAIEQMAPRFLEDLILKFADTPKYASPEALLRLNTPRSKQKIAELAQQSGYPALQQRAIQALAETRDPTYLPLLIRIAGKSAHANRDTATLAIGLFGNAALPFLKTMLRNTEVNARVAAVRSLGLTRSRVAVPTLIAALQDHDDRVLDAATQSLAELTHRCTTKAPGNNLTPAQEYRRWLNWWRKNNLTAPIYGTDNCAQPQPID